MRLAVRDPSAIRFSRRKRFSSTVGELVAKRGRQVEETNPSRRELAELVGRADIDDITERAIVVTVLGDMLLSALHRLAQEHVSRTHFETVHGLPAQEA
jgi:hypothetical protein